MDTNKIDNTIYLISKVRKAANQFLIQSMKEEGIEGLATSHGEIIMLLIKKQEISMSEIAQTIGKGPSTVTTLVDKLKKQGYVATKKSSECGRTTLVFMTEKGKELESRYKKISEQLNTIYKTGLTENEIQQLRELLQKVYSNFENHTN